MRIKQSVCIPMIKPSEVSNESFIRDVAKIGFQAVEIWNRGDDFDEIVSLARRHKLVLSSMCGHTDGLGTGGLNSRSQHERIETELKESIGVAAAAGVPGIICFSGIRNAGQTDADAIATCVQGLRRVTDYAERKGVNLNMELLNSKIDHAGYQCDHTAWGVAICEQLKHPRFRLLYDVYHMQIMEGDVIRTIQQNIQWIAHFHTAGNPGRNDMDDTQELNYAGICRAIAATGYSGFVGHEFKPRGDVMDALRQTFSICNQG